MENVDFDFPEKAFLQDMFRKEIYAILFQCIDEKYNEMLEHEQHVYKMNEILYSIFKYELLYEEFANKPRFKDQIDCITYFDLIALWNVVEYVRKQNNISKNMGDISNQTMIQKCNLAWAWIAEYIVENEWEDIIECYQNK